MNSKTRWVAQTGILLALLIMLQFATKSFGQLVTGSFVNMVLAVAVLAGGFWCGFTIALLSPIIAFFLNIGPALLPLVPAICVGNIVFVSAIFLLAKFVLKSTGTKLSPSSYAAVLISAVIKFVVLYALVVLIVVPALSLPPQKAAVISAMFTWPQLITASIGGVLAATIAPALKGMRQ